MRKAKSIFLDAVPVMIMIALIPVVPDDYILTAIYSLIIGLALLIKRTPHDIVVLGFGFFVMIVSEYLFVSTGVETFNRNTLFGLMPLWLPFLWGYGFVAIKRASAELSA